MKNTRIYKQKDKTQGGEKEKHKRKMKLLIASLIFGILMVSSGVALWIFYAEDEFNIRVDSAGDPLSFSLEFPDSVMDVSISDQTENSSATLQNDNGDFEATLVFESITEPTDVLCPSIENDCTIDWNFEGNPVLNASNVTIPVSSSEIMATFSCRQNSCPQNWTNRVQITSLGEG